MTMNRNKLYLILITACTAGYMWLVIANQFNYSSKGGETGVCLIKLITHIPCPSCGTTRSLLSLSKGDFSGSLHWNPIGLLLAVIMIITPAWILYDLIKQKDSLFNFYNQAEVFLKRTWVAIPAILLVLTNWIWNIYKGL
jgi:hypothetical protein